MRSTQQFSVTLPHEMAADVRAKVASGEYASESEVIRDGLRALQERNRAVEHWLRNEVVPAFKALKADPSRGRSLEETRTALAKRHAARLAKTPER
jgi:antitoxin ParD1/3/4